MSGPAWNPGGRTRYGPGGSSGNGPAPDGDIGGTGGTGGGVVGVGVGLGATGDGGVSIGPSGPVGPEVIVTYRTLAKDGSTRLKRYVENARNTSEKARTIASRT